MSDKAADPQAADDGKRHIDVLAPALRSSVAPVASLEVHRSRRRRDVRIDVVVYVRDVMRGF